MAWVVLWLSFPPVHCTAQLYSMVTRQREKTNIRSGVAGYGKAVAACAALQNSPLLPRPTRDDDDKPESRLQEYLLITNKNVLC